MFFPHSLADTDEEALTWNRLKGMQLKDASTGKLVGTITGVDDSTINILLEVETANGSILVPAAEELIVDIDWQEREIHITIPEGLLTL